MSSAPVPPRRKGAMRMKDIPPEVLAQLNRAEMETLTLVELLAVDQPLLLKNILPALGLHAQAPQLLAAAEALRGAGVTVRIKGIGAALQGVLAALPRRERETVFERLATHTSDLPRTWACYALAADASLPLDERLRRVRRFAADSHMGVRESAWDSFRGYVERELPRGLKLLEPWVGDADANIRRCAVEATRPRGVWCRHIEALKADPAPALPLLEPVRADPSAYVQRSVANWLNDASKSAPEWVRAVCARWLKGAPPRQTAWIVQRALRTLNKPAASRGSARKTVPPKRRAASKTSKKRSKR